MTRTAVTTVEVRSTRTGSLTRLLFVAALLAATTGVARAQSLNRHHYRGGDQVLRAFAPVVETVGESTVRVKVDGKDAALGLVVDGDGYVLTKASRLQGEIVCRTRKGLELEAELVGVHHPSDLALLKVDAKNLPVPAWREEGDPRVGQWAVTPGLKSVPVSVGVVSVGRRKIERQRGILGIQIEDNDGRGVRIVQVFPDSGAEEAGLKAGDVVLQVDGKDVDTRKALVTAIGEFGPGETLSLAIRRDSEGLDVSATLGYPFTNLLERGVMQNRMGGELSRRRAGFDAVLQHDTYLRPEDCGGPIVDLAGRVIGINIARAGRTESYAIPADVVRALIEELRSGKLAAPRTESVETKETDRDESADRRGPKRRKAA